MRVSLAALLLLACAPARAADLRAVETVSLPAAPLTAGANALDPAKLPPALRPAALPPLLSAAPAPLGLLPAASVVPAAAPEPAPPAAAGAAAEGPRAVPALSSLAGASGPSKGVPGSGDSARNDPAAKSAELSRRFDGAPLLATTERGPGGRVLREAYRDGDGGTVWVSRTLSHGRYEAQEHRLERAPRASDAPAAAVAAKLDGGVLRVSVDGKDARALDAARELDRALALFGRGVRAVQGGLELRPWAAAAGFTRALPSPEGAGLVLFARAEDVVRGRDGALWRRTRERAVKHVTFSRYESAGGRVLWLERRDERRERLFYEFHGEGPLKPGTPADAMAIFSRREDGRLSEYVDGARALVLDVDAERAAFAGGR